MFCFYYNLQRYTALALWRVINGPKGSFSLFSLCPHCFYTLARCLQLSQTNWTINTIWFIMAMQCLCDLYNLESGISLSCAIIFTVVKVENLAATFYRYCLLSLLFSLSSLGHLICTLISENQGLEKLRFLWNLRKISVPAHLNFFSVHLSFFSVCHLSFFFRFIP